VVAEDCRRRMMSKRRRKKRMRYAGRIGGD